MEITTHTPHETQEAGISFALGLNPGDVCIFKGDLGSGKTTFIQGMAQGLGVTSRIVSPTFIIMREYDTKFEDSQFIHMDLYRIESNIQEEIETLGIREKINEKKHFFAIEWGERLAPFLSGGTNIHFLTLESRDNIHYISY